VGEASREGDESQVERSRADGAAQIEESFRHCLTLSLFLSHRVSEVSGEVEEVDRDEGWT